MDELKQLGRNEEEEIKYEVANSSNYQLDNLDSEERQELIEEARRLANERADTFTQKLFQKIASFKAEASGDVKTILALNSLFARELDQHAAFPLEGFEHVINRFSDLTILYNNNYVQKEGSNLSTEASVYVIVEPEIYEEDAVTLGMTNFDRIKQATEIYDMDGVDYKLYLYINTDVYDLYNSLQEDLKNTLGDNFTIVSYLPNIDMRSKADVVVDYWSNNSVNEIVNSFLTSFGLFAHRRKKVYFSIPANDKRTKAFGPLDFLLLAESNLSNLLIPNDTVQALAKHSTKIWLADNSNFKFQYEEIEDFFNSPNLVLVQGLSPVYGIITAKKMRIKGAVIDVDTGEETLIDFDIDNEGEISGIHYKEELDLYLKLNTQNLRSNLIKWRKQVIRVSSTEKSVTILGKNIRSTKNASKYELKGDLSSITFLSKFYKEDSYNNLMKLKGAKPFHLPERFKTYLLRLAHSNGFLVPEVDTRWFSRNNNVLPEVLAMLDEKFDLDNILGYSISSTDGILNKELLVSLEGLKCLTKEN